MSVEYILILVAMLIVAFVLFPRQMRSAWSWFSAQRQLLSGEPDLVASVLDEVAAVIVEDHLHYAGRQRLQLKALTVTLPTVEMVKIADVDTRPEWEKVLLQAINREGSAAARRGYLTWRPVQARELILDYRTGSAVAVAPQTAPGTASRQLEGSQPPRSNRRLASARAWTPGPTAPLQQIVPPTEAAAALAPSLDDEPPATEAVTGILLDVVVEGRSVTTVAAPVDQTFWIGRQPRCLATVPADETRVSGHHVQLRALRDGETLEVITAPGRHGSRVVNAEGERKVLSGDRVRRGDRIELGSDRVSVELR